MSHNLELGTEKQEHEGFNSEIAKSWAKNQEYTSSISTELSVGLFSFSLILLILHFKCAMVIGEFMWCSLTKL